MRARGTEWFVAEEDDFSDQQYEFDEQEFDERVSQVTSRAGDGSFAHQRMTGSKAVDFKQREYGGGEQYYEHGEGQEEYYEDQSNSHIEEIVEEAYEEVGEIGDPERERDF